ncbi:MAG: tRNA (guanosine(46)-N7)-methyltransferase TrmB [Sphingomonadaceae bacterium]|uniref:tRNA (guanosine(46)-N7)-methyltransferase TrmB n=1 Tax=Thermaurantiacus sp. TaxID=2820283 RepID=UPI00298F25C2|nr:tRNA (guanosine(46)-N7)-methyltransferase TrmB [Thermaurantiacus sp.]MCS6987376.1 tRNA (guanosine(46)-N7)-methyltransferase TrmB [Sphingomonadaceae bacterium]MDW8415294.1 tRNA (guanosine(46)-N7)-methyltransferase TrmB [Thermaurantiacus sp.]
MASFPGAASDPLSIRRLYGRRQGPALKPNARRLVDEWLPRLAIPSEGPLSAVRLFGDERPLALEIGFGKGEHLAFQAARRPDWGFLGAEPYLNGVAGLLARIEAAGLANLRIHRGDALEVLERLAPGSLVAVYLLHPDPWPKARHAKRRFINPGPVKLLARAMAPGAELRIATDHPVFLRHTLAVMQHEPDFAWTAEGPEDWREVPADWPDTRFALKARRLGHDVWRLLYRRR